MHHILVINLGSTSTKTAIYRDKVCLVDQTLRHSKEDIESWGTAGAQVSGRAACIRTWLSETGYSLDDMSAIGLRGCAFSTGKRSGTYIVTQALREDWLKPVAFDKPMTHAVRIGLSVVEELLDGRDIPVYVTDPPSVDELREEARLTGNSSLPRKCQFHALNSKAAAYKAAEKLGLDYFKSNLVVAHLGGGVSIAAHEQGRVVDVNDCFSGDGPFSTDRSGGVPALALIDMCFSGKTKDECAQAIKGPSGGVVSYLGTSDMREVEKRIGEGDQNADLVFRSMAHQISKEIGACYTAMRCKVDAIVITGGIAYSEKMVNLISDYVGYLAPIVVLPGEFENEALAFGALRVLNNVEEAIAL